jgi:hypothetical protein
MMAAVVNTRRASSGSLQAPSDDEPHAFRHPQFICSQIGAPSAKIIE